MAKGIAIGIWYNDEPLPLAFIEGDNLFLSDVQDHDWDTEIQTWATPAEHLADGENQMRDTMPRED